MNEETWPSVIIFQQGALKITPSAMAALEANKTDVQSLVDRHLRGDWGNVPNYVAGANAAALIDGDFVFSLFSLANGIQIVILTEADRSITKVMVPKEY